MGHFHIGVINLLVTFAHVIIVGFFWRYLAMRYHETAIGKAMAFAY